jgi:UDP-N-acetylmuramyl pentapeptide phosphotransferase/UDP-N-acetylglucosamine-1-phosphate transferase
MAACLWIMSIGFLSSSAAGYLISRYRGRWAVLDQPNQRSLHAKPLPRLGGVGIIYGILSTAILVWWLDHVQHAPTLLPLLMGFAIIVCISLLDDIYKVPVILRLISHSLAAMLVIYVGLSLNILAISGWSIHPPTVVAAAFSILFIVWMTNLYNFMDGMDGLAAGMGVIGFGTFAIMGWQSGAIQFAQLSAGIAASCAGFLWLNFPPAKIFMGDNGSASLGFLAAVFMLWANHHNIFPLWVGVAAFLPFIADATWTLVRRIIRGKRFWHAHREHFYQRLLQLGWGQRKTVLSEYAVMLVCSLTAIVLNMTNRSLVQIGVLVFVLLVFIVLVFLINGLEARKGQGKT